MNEQNNKYEIEKVINYFAFSGHKEIDGWISVYSLSLVYLINEFQKNNTIIGNVVEVGVFHGKFFIALSLLLRTNEKSLAIDVFDDQIYNIDGAGVGDFNIFLENLRIKLGDIRDVKILKTDSLQIDHNRLLAEFDQRRVRIFSIDGCHTAQHTENDLLLAANVIAPGGVIILDDYGNPNWPGVEIGLQQFLAKCSSVVPCISAYNKLYLTTVDFHGALQSYISDIILEVRSGTEYEYIAENLVLKAQMPIPEALFQSKYLSFIDFSSRNEFCRHYLISGWSFLEPWGVWSDGNNAMIQINLPEQLSKRLFLFVAFHAFVAAGDIKRNISIHVESCEIDSFDFCFGQEYEVRRYAIDLAKLNAKKNIQVMFMISNPISPQALGLSADMRQLGIGLQNVYFMDEKDFLSSVPAQTTTSFP